MSLQTKKTNNKKNDQVLTIFLRKLDSKLDSNLKKVILFGSRARDDSSEESDYDFILIFDKVTRKVKKDLDELATDMLINYGMVITDFAFTEKELERKRYEPFIMNARKEGVLILG